MFFGWLCKVHNLNNYTFYTITQVCACVSMKVTTSRSFRGKQISKIRIFEAIILKQNEGVQLK